jgi:predicted AAA+ superfamily ATPase
MIPRAAAGVVRRLARSFPVLFVTGPRQSGKTTLAQLAFPRKAYVSLEDLDRGAFAAADPRGFLAPAPHPG